MDRAQKHIAVNRSVWHREVGTTKTEQSERLVAINDELREIFAGPLEVEGSPIGGYILAGRKKPSGHPRQLGETHNRSRPRKVFGLRRIKKPITRLLPVISSSGMSLFRNGTAGIRCADSLARRYA